jgi:putative PIN family toxin of toxin-antitoxin system
MLAAYEVEPSLAKVRAAVLDTNIVLDVFVFADKAAEPLLQALVAGRLRWLTTQVMRDEFERVLAYSPIAKCMAMRQLSVSNVLANFDGHATMVDAPSKASIACTDDDDQKFIDLAVTQKSLLLSKDAAVLAMKKRLAALGVDVAATMPVSSYMLIES